MDAVEKDIELFAGIVAAGYTGWLDGLTVIVIACNRTQQRLQGFGDGCQGFRIAHIIPFSPAVSDTHEGS